MKIATAVVVGLTSTGAAIEVDDWTIGVITGAAADVFAGAEVVVGATGAASDGLAPRNNC